MEIQLFQKCIQLDSRSIYISMTCRFENMQKARFSSKIVQIICLLKSALFIIHFHPSVGIIFFNFTLIWCAHIITFTLTFFQFFTRRIICRRMIIFIQVKFIQLCFKIVDLFIPSSAKIQSSICHLVKTVFVKNYSVSNLNTVGQNCLRLYNSWEKSVANLKYFLKFLSNN